MNRARWAMSCLATVMAASVAFCGPPPPPAVAPFNAQQARRHQDAWAEHLGKPREVTNSIGMKLVLIPPGEFMMGSGESAEELAEAFEVYGALSAGFFEGELPRHRVRITRPFYLGVHEVTVGQFRQFVERTGYRTDAEKGMGASGIDSKTGKVTHSVEYSWRNAFEQTDEHPVVNVSWNDAVAFCEWLSEKEGREYRLPTEAEWEYACRARTTTRYYHGDDPEGLATVGNVADATLRAQFPGRVWAIKADDGYVFTAPVGKFQPNAYGLHDMHGNVWEWCADWYDSDYYANSPVADPQGPGSGLLRVYRGGGWHSLAEYCRSAFRFRYAPFPRCGRGFRLALVPAK